MSSARSVGVIYDDKPLVQLRKEDKLANHSSQRNNASEEQPLRQCWGPRNIVALSDKGLIVGIPFLNSSRVIWPSNRSLISFTCFLGFGSPLLKFLIWWFIRAP